MKFLVFSLCLLVLAQATPIDKLRQQAARASRIADSDMASDAAADRSLSFLERQQELAFEMEKESGKHELAEADAVENLAKSEVEEAASVQTQDKTSTQDKASTQTETSAAEKTDSSAQQQQQQQQATTQTTTTTTSSSTKSDKVAAYNTDKPMQWEDAVLVEDLTKERATADAYTKFIGANMKTSKVGQAKAAPSFLQMGAPYYYYPVHPAFLEQAQRMHAQQQQTQTRAANTEGRAEEGAQAQGWGDYGTPLYYASQFGSFDGLGAGGANMYGNFGYAPYTSGYNPAYTQAAGGASTVGGGFTPGAGAYFSPYGNYAPYSPPPPPPMPVDLPLPPYIQ